MKKLLITLFLFSYTAFTVVLTTEATLALIQGFNRGAKSHVSEMKPYSPHVSQRRFVEQPFQIVPASIASPLTRAESHVFVPTLAQLADNINPQAPTRAPPALY
jgi:hypothetical protein